MPSTLRIVVLALAAAAGAGCAGVQVRSVGTNTGNAAYDLVGPDLGALDAQARRLCPQGHVVLRQWERTNRAADSGDANLNWLYRNGVLSYDLQPEQAQMSIVCKG